MIPIDFTVLIQAITGIANPTALLRNKLERNEAIIRLLKQFNLSPDSPPADFGGVYAYTLVEYGVGKPKAVLELFRQPEIRQAFQDAWGQDNFSVLSKAGESFLENATLGDELRALGIEARQEFYQFAAVFIAIAKRTRTPGDILTTQQLNSLHRQVAQVQDRLERLPTIEGIRTEMARLAAQSLPALPEASVSEQCRAFALAQQMRGWFETLGYRFEPYEQWQADGFEWILNIPVRRGRYDRILVRGIEGEAELRDVMALRQSVEAQQTDEGWLVTSRRISRAARDEVEKPENRHLDCYTFDELVDLDADFTGYIKWLETEIKHRKIDTRYVPLGCTKEEIDPDTQQRLGVSRYDERDGWIDGYLDRWLDDPAKEHISVLGEFGTGKTWVAFHYAWTALQRYQEAKERGVQRPRLPLVITLRDYAKALNVENVLAGFFFTQHNIRLNSEVFDQLNRMGKLLLIFDGFDEMAAKVDKQQMINNFWELAKVVVPGAKVILTCRTEHFPDAREGRALLNAQLQASTSNLTGETPQFEVLELEKFNDEQIRQVMSFQASMPTVDQVISNPQLLDLARRPVMTELILEALPEIEAGKPIDMSRVYLYAVRRKMERDIKAERTFTSLADKLYFLCELSWEMLSSDRMSLNYREFPDRIRRLFGSAVQEEKDLDHWHYDMMGQTMLIRNADGDYSPAHRSLLEFFVAYKFAAELGLLAPDFLELIQTDFNLDYSTLSQQSTWSECFAQQSNCIGQLKKLGQENLEILGLSFGKVPLSKAIVDLLVPMLSSATTDSLIELIYCTRNESPEKTRFTGGNAVTVIMQLDKNALKCRDLQQINIQGADLSLAILHQTNFSGANLAESKLANLVGRTTSVALSSDDNLLAAGGYSGMVRIFHLRTSKEIINFSHFNLVASVAFSPSNQFLATASHDATVKLWDVQTGECACSFEEHSGRVHSVKFHPNGRFLASGGSDGTVRLWDIQHKTCVFVLSGRSRVREVSFSQDGKKLASCSDDQTIKLWDVETGRLLFSLEGHTDKVLGVEFSPKEQILASCGRDKTVKLWNSETGSHLMTISGHLGRVNKVTFSQDGTTLASCSQDKTIKLWSLDGQCLKTLNEHTDYVYSVVFNSDGSTLVSGGRDQSIKVWDVEHGISSQTIRGFMSLIRVTSSPDGHFLAIGSNDGEVQILERATQKVLYTLKGHTSWIGCAEFNNNSNVIASAGGDRVIKLWDVHSGHYLGTLGGHSSRIHSLAFSPDDALIVSSSSDDTLRVWDFQSQQCLSILEGHTDKVLSVCFSPNGQLILSSSADRTIKIWNLAGQCLQTLEGHTDWVQSVSFSPDGEIIASGGDDLSVRLWNPVTGELVKALYGHSGWIESVCFSPDGQLLASGSSDGIIKLWNARTGEFLQDICGSTHHAFSVSFSPDGQQIISGGSDVRFWDVKTGKCLKTFANRPYEGMNITEVKGLTESEIATLKALGAIED